MALYSNSIHPEFYKYSQPLYVSEISGTDRNLVAIKLNLNSSNFNFDLLREDGLDFRLAEKSNGSGVLLMWIAYWEYSSNKATVWFKLPYLEANDTKELWAFWGFAGDSGISDLSTLVDSDPIFLLADDFVDVSLDSSNWSGSSGSFIISDSVLILGTDAYVTSNIVLTTRSFIVEEGIIGTGNPTSTTYYAYRTNFITGDNTFQIQYFWNDSVDRKHNFVSGGSVITYDGVDKGLEIGSYSHNYVAYYEETDTIYQSMVNRNTLSDYEDSWERKVHRNTTPTQIRIYGPDDASSAGTTIDWVIAREYDPTSEPEIDLSNLYVEYEDVAHQVIDTAEYLSDVTDIAYYHYSSMGGDPYRMSDNVSTGISNSFISDDGITEGYILIDFGRSAQRENTDELLHLTNSAYGFYNAAKLSDLNVDEHDRTYWQATRSSGAWAAIRFSERITISSISVKAVTGQLTKMIKNYNIYGSNSDPRFNGWQKKVLLRTGQFSNIEDEQVVYLTNTSSYLYYILEAIDSYGDNIALQEWSFYRRSYTAGRKVISQLRLKPIVDGINEYYFPKQIKLEGSNDSINWTTLINTINTPTPFTDYIYGRWSRYSFTNDLGYYAYKLTCYNNWSPATDQIKISEWEMVERAEESDSYRILVGSNNNINSIWTASGTGYNSGYIYITNDYINTIFNNELIEYSTISGSISDINVIGS